MLKKTDFVVPLDLLSEASNSLPSIDFKISINKPTNRFFYDSWVLRDEFVGTIWETIYSSLPVVKGEARIIKLDTTQSYTCHGDIDDRYHLTILGSDKSYLVDLKDDILYKTVTDGVWYNMNAGKLHSAVNFNDQPRYQLVVRHLLVDSRLDDPVTASIVPNCDKFDHRFVFDQCISPWLNTANKMNIISNFSLSDSGCNFNIERRAMDSLKLIVPKQFDII